MMKPFGKRTYLKVSQGIQRRMTIKKGIVKLKYNSVKGRGYSIESDDLFEEMGIRKL